MSIQVPPKEQRIEWWREARFGMFIHWGLYSIPAGEWQGRRISGIAEWIMNSAQIPVKDYEPLKDQFNPTKFDAKQWVKIAKDAGMKYIVITSKHHDGYALWDSKVSDYDVMASPFKRDILKELAEECRAQGMKLGFYHSIMDWHHPDYGQRRPWDPRADKGEPNMDKYTAYMKAQLKELLTEYGDVAVVWFDGEWESPWTHERGVDLYNYCLSLQPKTLVNNRVDKGRNGMAGMTGKGYMGDFGTPEQEIPARGFPGVDWESCMTLNDTWGFDKNDHNWKSTTTLIQNLVDIASKGGNYLLNVGPNSLGEIPQESVQRLHQMGDWLKMNGESIYGTTATPFSKSPFHWTQKPGVLYLHISNWPGAQTLTLPGIGSKVTGVSGLSFGGKKPFDFNQSDKTLAIELPSAALSPHSSVIEIRYEGRLNVEDIGLAQAADGSLSLSASLADIHGTTLKHEGGWLGFWTNEEDWASWDFQAIKPGRYHLIAEYACAPEMQGSTAEFLLGDDRLSLRVQSTGSWQKFISAEIGDVTIEKAGPMTLIVRPKDVDGGALMNLRALHLAPADDESISARIDQTWNFGNPAESFDKFKALAEAAANPTEKAIYETQMARTYSLRSQFDEANAVLDAIHADMTLPSELTVRILLERGRTLNSGGKKAEAVPVFKQAMEYAQIAQQEALALDAVHMLGIAAPPEEAVTWHKKSLELIANAKTRKAKMWAGAVLNNYGWTLFDMGQHEQALEILTQAWEYRKTRPQASERMVAAYAVGRVLREMKRYDEALAIQQQVQDELDDRKEEDGFVQEELGELLLVMGNEEAAKDHFANAYRLLSSIGWLADSEAERLGRIKRLAGA